MKIKRLRIKNFRSLRDITLDELDNLIVLIGKNSSGKSNILEALSLFFNEFAIAGGNTPGLNEYFWFNRHIKEPIEFTLAIELQETELKDIFPEDVLKFISEKYDQTYNQLTICRHITNLQGTWITKYLKWAELALIEDDKQATPEGLSELLVQRVEPGVLIPQITPQVLSTIFTNITKNIKGKIKFIAAIRDVKYPMAHRMTLIDSSIQSRLWSLDQSTAVSDETKYTEVENSFRRITGQKLDLAQGQIFIRKGARRLPLYLEGGGIQGTTNLIYELKSEPEKEYIFGIEEPESHSHPDLQRKIFNDIKLLSEKNQIFIATHSPIFIDRADPNNTWIVKIVANETRIERIEELKEIIEEIGAKPSDIFFFADKILFVEGKTEELVLPAFAQRLGIDIDDIAIIPVEGKNQARLSLKTWVSITRNALPIFLILDSDAKEDIEGLVKEGLIQSENYHLWQEGSIEDYYSIDILTTALGELNSLFNLGIDVSKIVSQIKEGKLKPSRIDLGEKQKLLGKSWKVVLAEVMAKHLKEKEVRISDEVRRVLEKVVAS